MIEDVSFLEKLNDIQRHAVEYVDGPQLIIAGAGSGKTMVLTYKVVYLLRKGLLPFRILALTFTNKAANEMKERIGALVGIQESNSLWMGTFHSVFSRILRKEAEHIGFMPNYTIYTPSDSKSLVKSIIKELSLDEKTYDVKFILSRISEAKNHLITSREYMTNRNTKLRDNQQNMPRLGYIYNIYVERCKQANAMDFDDLLLHTFCLFRNHPEIQNKYAEWFQYILVDEYQDTNYAQHKILSQLASVHQRICVVGDDAQSIYSFRGAVIDNILNFTKEYSNAQMFKLEQNYRSTQTIVGAANSLIAHNKRQIPKQVYSLGEKGMPIIVKEAFSDEEEGQIVSNEIKKLHCPYDHIAILYRTNGQSRIFEKVFRKDNIPYRIYGGMSFYDQKIIKDVLAYFRLIINRKDDEAFKRIVNFPARGIGDVTQNKILHTAIENNLSMWEVLIQSERFCDILNASVWKKLKDFQSLIESFLPDTQNAFELGEQLMKRAGFNQLSQANSNSETLELRENISELLNSMSVFVEERQELGDLEHVHLVDYLNDVALMTDMDKADDDNQPKVSLMTVHASKGLEFDVVFVVGLNEEIFPYILSLYSPRELEEERRLMYVAITRAKSRCFLSNAKSRFSYGKMDFYDPSRFLEEIDTQYLSYGKINTRLFSEPIFEKSHTNHLNIFPAQSKNAPQNPSMRKIVQTHSSNSSQTILIQGKSCKVGSSVEHNRFGHGVVKAIRGQQENTILTIEFQNVGEKQLLLKYARLTII